MTGLLVAPGDVLVTIDADLQDDLNAIHDMLRAAVAGADIAYGVRRMRPHDTPMKRLTARLSFRRSDLPDQRRAAVMRRHHGRIYR
jgi:glycosyltransferase involved in cell wall biosynthesis